MSPAQFEIQAIAVVVAAACALPGVFLVLRRVSMMSDAISHAILPGLVVAFFVTEDLGSPLLIAAAAATGVLTVVLIEALGRTGRVKEDAAIGLVFPIMFSIGVILIARFASDVHLDVDAVLLGELAFAPFNRFEIGGVDVGPQALWVMGPILALNLVFLAVFFKELKLSTFDAGLAAALGFAPTALHYALMSLVSVTAVGAFDAVGSILVVALMIGPPAAAYLLTDRLPVMLGLSVGIGVVCAVAGYWTANVFDTSIAGAMATTVGVAFGLTFALAPERGLVAKARLRRTQRRTFAEKMLAVHLLHHEDTPQEARECRIPHLQEHLRWTPDFARQAVDLAVRDGYVQRYADRLVLTSEGRAYAQESMVE
jgi:manganese/zinc/iron transport system permease protein